jgi:RNA polymerase sigma factor FliA
MNAYAAQTHAGPTAIPAAYGQSADDLVRQHKALVRRIAWQVHGRIARDTQLDDLVQIGFMALVEAGRTYEDQGHSFVTYATMRIRGSMIDHLRREMMTGRGAVRTARRIDVARNTLYQQTGCNPTAAELARALGVSDSEYFELEQQAAAGQRVSIDDSDENLIGLLGLEASAADALEQSDLLHMLAGEIAKLSQREQLVLQLYFFEELNLHEIGAVLGVSAARACQIKAGALVQLKENMQQCIDV